MFTSASVENYIALFVKHSTMQTYRTIYGGMLIALCTQRGGGTLSAVSNKRLDLCTNTRAI